MRVVRGLIQEKIMHDHAIHRRQTSGHMFGVGVRLQNIFTLTVQALSLIHI